MKEKFKKEKKKKGWGGGAGGGQKNNNIGSSLNSHTMAKDTLCWRKKHTYEVHKQVV